MFFPAQLEEINPEINFITIPITSTEDNKINIHFVDDFLELFFSTVKNCYYLEFSSKKAEIIFANDLDNKPIIFLNKDEKPFLSVRSLDDFENATNLGYFVADENGKMVIPTVSITSDNRLCTRPYFCRRQDDLRTTKKVAAKSLLVYLSEDILKKIAGGKTANLDAYLEAYDHFIEYFKDEEIYLDSLRLINEQFFGVFSKSSQNNHNIPTRAWQDNMGSADHQGAKKTPTTKTSVVTKEHRTQEKVIIIRSENRSLRIYYKENYLTLRHKIGENAGKTYKIAIAELYGDEHNDSLVRLISSLTTEEKPDADFYSWKLAEGEVEYEQGRHSLLNGDSSAAITYFASSVAKNYFPAAIAFQDMRKKYISAANTKDHKDPNDMFILAKLLETEVVGKIVASFEESFYWYQKAVWLGHQGAIARLDKISAEDKLFRLSEADKYFREGLVAIEVGNNDLAFNKFHLAAEAGHIDAQYTLAVCYDKGLGIDKSEEYAITWYNKAAKHGHLDAQFALACSFEDKYLKSNSPIDESYNVILANVLDLYRSAALSGHIAAMNNLASLRKKLLMNLDDNLDDEIAVFFIKASEGGSNVASYNLGSICEDRSKNIKLADSTREELTKCAIKWYETAYEQGNKDAEAKIKELKLVRFKLQGPYFSSRERISTV